MKNDMHAHGPHTFGTLDDGRAPSLVTEGNLPASAALARLTSDLGVDEATRVLVDAGRSGGALVLGRESGGPPLVPEHSSSMTHAPRVLVVPAFLHERFPQHGGRGEVALDAARARGLDAHVVDTQSALTLDENAHVVAGAVVGKSRAVLVSMSRGGAEVRRAFELYPERMAAHVQAWVNVCGLVRGCAFVDVALHTLTRRALARASLQVLGADARVVSELRTDAPALTAPIVIPESVHVVNVVALPVTADLEGLARGRHARLASRGPNDGMSVVRQMLVLPGHVIVLEGLHHIVEHMSARRALDHALYLVEAGDERRRHHAA